MLSHPPHVPYSQNLLSKLFCSTKKIFLFYVITTLFFTYSWHNVFIKCAFSQNLLRNFFAQPTFMVKISFVLCNKKHSFLYSWHNVFIECYVFTKLDQQTFSPQQKFICVFMTLTAIMS